ncbi:hypothetical protein VTJ04DRAFT_8344 [Mycothermus thermophilus]|uniref:uncharacterized protein n=1 Tax=Humicola insolens TaxID=85995 RepID=UPI0037432AF9
MRLFITSLLGRFALLALAQTTTAPAETSPTAVVITVLAFAYDPSGLGASVISADPTATTYSVACPDGKSYCGFYSTDPPFPITIVSGPSTLAETVIMTGLDLDKSPITVTQILTCSVTATAPYGGPCMFYNGGPGFAVRSTFALEEQDPKWSMIEEATVTAGFEKLGNSGTSLRAPGGISILSACVALMWWMW